MTTPEPTVTVIRETCVECGLPHYRDGLCALCWGRIVATRLEAAVAARNAPRDARVDAVMQRAAERDEMQEYFEHKQRGHN